METDQLELQLNKSARWIIFLVLLLIYIYFGSLIWGFVGIKTGYESIFLLIAVGAVGGVSVNAVQPPKNWRNVFILLASLASLLVYFIGRWINFHHFIVMKNVVVENGAFQVSQSILSSFSLERFISFSQNSPQFFVLTDVVWIVTTLYVVQYVTVKKNRGKHEDHNFHTDRRSRFRRKFDR